MKRIAFYQPHLDLWGTGTACYDYAYFNQSILDNESIVIYDKHNESTHRTVLQKFKQADLKLIPIEGDINISNLNIACKKHKVDAVYIHKTGAKDNRFIEEFPTFIHACGVINQPHGTVYAYVSEWLSQHCSNNNLPFVPLMVHLPETENTLRKKYNIPDSAIVFGRTGGPYSWNIPFVNQVIVKILENRQDIYFLFLNTNKFIDHDRVIFVEPFADLKLKREFINTCDAMIHARAEGESFGLACAEFSTCKKPVITYYNSPEKNHIFTLKEQGIYYTDYTTLLEIFTNFIPSASNFYNAYQDSTPEKSIQKFKEVFINAL